MWQPAREVDVPAQFDSLSQQVNVADVSTDWRSILCETNATETKVKEIARALATAKFEPGPIDGVIRDKTMKPVNLKTAVGRARAGHEARRGDGTHHSRGVRWRRAKQAVVTGRSDRQT